MTKIEKFLIDNGINNVLTNPQEPNPKNWIYVSDVINIWEGIKSLNNNSSSIQKKTNSRLCKK